MTIKQLKQIWAKENIADTTQILININYDDPVDVDNWKTIRNGKDDEDMTTEEFVLEANTITRRDYDTDKI